jgi:hypothetical protein
MTNLAPKRLSKKNGLLCWHFLPDDGRTAHDHVPVVVGQTLDGIRSSDLALCERGYHASVRPLDALQFAPGTMIQRCVLHGTVITDTDKAVATRRTCLWIADATQTLHGFALWCAEWAIENSRKIGIVPHANSLKALQVKRLWLDGQATDEELAAARGAARGAAWDAARGAAWAASWDAARDAAWGAARGAARAAAWAAAPAAAWGEFNTELERRLSLLEPRI